MKSVLIRIKNLIPYLVLIAIYFFFVNLEARNERNKKNNSIQNNEINVNNYKTDKIQTNKTISIPVLPYKQ